MNKPTETFLGVFFSVLEREGYALCVTRDTSKYTSNLHREKETRKVVILTDGSKLVGIDPIAYLTGDETCREYLRNLGSSPE